MTDSFHILVVEDEPDVRATFRDWLRSGVPRLNLIEAENAAEALDLAGRHPVDLAVLDWNLGAGVDGLQVLKSLSMFRPDIVAILVTGHADLATPLKALKLGVRDYLDKHAGLDRAAFLAAVNRQLERIAPLKRERAFHAGLVRFRDALSAAMPLLSQAGALRPGATARPMLELARLVARAIPNSGGMLVALDGAGGASVAPLSDDGPPRPCAGGERSLAAQSVATGAVIPVDDAAGLADDPTVSRLPAEPETGPLLAIPLGLRHALELFGTQGRPFGPEAEALARLAGPVGLALEQAGSAMAEAIAQLGAAVDSAMEQASGLADDARVAARVRDNLEVSWRELLPPGAGEAGLRAARALAELAGRHGVAALDHAAKLIAATADLLDSSTGGPG